MVWQRLAADAELVERNVGKRPRSTFLKMRPSETIRRLESEDGFVPVTFGTVADYQLRALFVRPFPDFTHLKGSDHE
jgi:hypothetical protein